VAGNWSLNKRQFVWIAVTALQYQPYNQIKNCIVPKGESRQFAGWGLLTAAQDEYGACSPDGTLKGALRNRAG
jgi:hypothetical protein